MSARSIQGRLAAEQRHRPNENHDDLRREFAEARLAEHIQRTLAAAPPLTDAQRRRLAELLRGGA